MKNPLIDVFRAVATNGGEYGPQFDRGVLHAFDSFEKNSNYAPDKLVTLVHFYCTPGLQSYLKASELKEVESYLSDNSLTKADAASFTNGIIWAMSVIRR